MIRAAVIIPPIQDFYITPHRISSLGVKTVCRILCKSGIRTLLIDGLNQGKSSAQIQLPQELSYLEKFIVRQETGRLSYFTRFQHFGSSYDTIADQIKEFMPEICFISCFAFCYSGTVMELSQVIKNRFPEMTIVAGGAGVSVYPEYFLNRAQIDYTLSGEAEVCLPAFISYLKNKRTDHQRVPGLGWKESGICRKNPADVFTTADTLQPLITRTFENRRRTVLTASLSRGCPASCRFCSNHLAHGKKFRHCSVEQFNRKLDEIPGIPAEQEVSINFEDDNLLYDFTFLRSIVEQCRKRFPRVRFTAENGLDYRLLSEDQCRELIQAGFAQFNFTLGSLSQDILNGTERTINLDHYSNLLDIISQQSIPVITYVICGFPDDTKETVAFNLRFLSDKKTIIGLSLFYPVPGIPGFKDSALFDSISPGCLCGSAAYSWSRNLSTGSLITLFRLARLLNLMKSPKKSGVEHAVISLIHDTGRLHTVVKEGKKRVVVPVPGQDDELVKMVIGKGHL